MICKLDTILSRKWKLVPKTLNLVLMTQNFEPRPRKLAPRKRNKHQRKQLKYPINPSAPFDSNPLPPHPTTPTPIPDIIIWAQNFGPFYLWLPARDYHTSRELWPILPVATCQRLSYEQRTLAHFTCDYLPEIIIWAENFGPFYLWRPAGGESAYTGTRLSCLLFHLISTAIILLSTAVASSSECKYLGPMMLGEWSVLVPGSYPIHLSCCRIKECFAGLDRAESSGLQKKYGWVWHNHNQTPGKNVLMILCGATFLEPWERFQLWLLSMSCLVAQYPQSW